jgi:hypothetical protein
VIKQNVHVIGMGFLIVVGGCCGDTLRLVRQSTMPSYFKKFGANRDAENWRE